MGNPNLNISMELLWRVTQPRVRCCRQPIKFFVALVFLFIIASQVSATTYFVSQQSTNPVAPYTDWTTAATNIQDAAGRAVAGDLVLVSNGVYQYGAKAKFVGVTNRVFLTNGVTMQSVNGPAVTTILGYQPPGIINGTNSVRGVYLGTGAFMSGFTVAGGSTWNGNSGYGGGVHCDDTSAIVSNCVITGNSGAMGGGGAAGCTLIDCIISNNVASQGGPGGGVLDSMLVNCLVVSNSTAGSAGGAWFCVCSNCTLVGNTASSGGGAYGGIFDNCILYYNIQTASGSLVTNVSSATLNYCCVTPSQSGTGNFTSQPAFADLAHGNFRLQPGSPCIDAGNNIYAPIANDLDGNPRIARGSVDVGAYEFQNTSAFHYVNLANASPVAPYTNWATAATNIQDAIGVAQSNEFVVVSNGTYNFGSVVVYGGEANRVAITNPVNVLSLNGPQSTTILSGNSGMRCVYVGSNATLSGFTLANGHTQVSGDILKEQSGAGAWCEPSGVISNCVVLNNMVANASTGRGGGIFGGTAYNTTVTANSAGVGGGVYDVACWGCAVSNNMAGLGGGGAQATLFNSLVSSNIAQGTATGGGVYQCVLSNCTLSINNAYGGGAGAYQSVLYNCLISSNLSSTGSGGAYLSALYNCTVTGNSGSAGGGTENGTNFSCLIAYNQAGNGGGCYSGTNYNCIIVSNSAASGGGGVYQGTDFNCTITGNSCGSPGGGGVYSGSQYNSIIYSNTSSSGANWSGGSLFNCCTTPSVGVNCVASDPQFVDAADGNFQLKCASPCIDAGATNFFPPGIVVSNDFRGMPRPIDAKYDIGAYEFNAATDETPAIVPLPFSLVAANFPMTFTGDIVGCQDYYYWNFGDGTVVSNQNGVTHSWTSPGTYNVQLSAYFSSLGGEMLSATTQVRVVAQTIYYVNASNASPLAPYTNWAHASKTIQQAISADTTPGRLVLVTNGLYKSPGIAVNGTVSNGVALTNPVIVLSVNGPAATTIMASNFFGRCAYVGSNAFLGGFTLTGGQTLTSGSNTLDESGGGVWCETSGVVSNCLIVSNTANCFGGGGYQGTYYNCAISNNVMAPQNFAGAQGGGVYSGTLYHCTIAGNVVENGTTFGGGVSASVLSNCTVTGNSATYGGGASGGTIYNCVISSNTATYGGGSSSNTVWNSLLFGNTALTAGGANAGTLLNCTVVNNYANSGVAGITSVSGPFMMVTNCIVYSNTNRGSSTTFNFNGASLFYHSCTFPVPIGTGNITNPPIFMNAAAGDYHLHFGSPGIDAGTDLSANFTNDLDGNLRPLDGNGDGLAAFDLGAYEFNLLNAVGTSWLISHGLNPNDPNVFSSHPNGNPYSVLQSWIADTDPNTFTPLAISTFSNSLPVTVSFNGSANRVYTLQSSTDLINWSAVANAVNVPGVGGMTTLQDGNPGSNEFYRVVVSVP